MSMHIWFLAIGRRHSNQTDSSAGSPLDLISKVVAYISSVAASESTTTGRFFQLKGNSAPRWGIQSV